MLFAHAFLHLHDARDGISPAELGSAILLHRLPKRVLQRSVRDLKTLALGRSQEFARQRFGHALHLRPRGRLPFVEFWNREA